MDSYRTERLNQSILRILSDLLQVAVKDPRVGLVSINSVKLNRDHSVAKVFFSTMGDPEERSACLTGLKKARGFLQGRIGNALRLRQVPQLRFVYDESLDHGLDIQAVLRDLEDQGEFESESERLRRRRLEELVPPEQLLDDLCAAEYLWVVPHSNPDPDAIGAALALAAGLEAAGRRALVVAYPDPPATLADLPGYADSLVSTEAEQAAEEELPDAVVLVDCHRLDRTGELVDLLARIPKAFSIDHHLVSGRRMPLPGWTDASVCSACTLVYAVLEALSRGGGGRCDPFAIDEDMATCLYAGLLTDSGGFRFTNTTPLSFELGGRLAALGVDTAGVARRCLYRHRVATIDLFRRCLESCEFFAGGRILTMRVDREMLGASGATLTDSEGFINFGTATEGVRFVALIKELDDGVWRCSLRVRGEEGDVQVVAAGFGGGGHRQAAGCTIEGDAAEVVDLLVAALMVGL